MDEASPASNATLARKEVEERLRYEWSEIWAALMFIAPAAVISLLLALLIWPLAIVAPAGYWLYKWWHRKLVAVANFTEHLDRLEICGRFGEEEAKR